MVSLVFLNLIMTKTATLFLIIIMPFFAFSQANKSEPTADTLLKNIITKLNTYSTNHTTEKVYLHLDKPYYAAGDTIYFKAYVTQGGQHELSQISEILHVELVNNKNKISQELKLKLTGGFAWGDFALPDTLTNGKYHIRAYANIMLNNGENSFFDGAISVTGLKIKKGADSVVAGKVQAGKPGVQFFPEGGNLNNGIDSKIAFKAVAANGLGIDVDGVITDDENKEVATFKSSRFGMGTFNFIPHNGKTYKAKVTFSDGSESITDLPKATNNGYSLIVDDKDKEVIAVMVMAGSVPRSRTTAGSLSLVAQAGGVIYSAAKGNPGAHDFTALFSKKSFPSGIVQITLFSPEGEPLNERLLFIQAADQIKLNASTFKKSYAVREKVTIDLEATAKQDKPVAGSFSIAVTDETKAPVDEAAENTILTNLLLTSEVKGYVEHPNYYFSNPDAKTQADLDVLMLTQGYRQFAWKQVLSNNYPPVLYKPEKANLEIAGYVKVLGKPVQGGKIKLLSKSGGGIVLDTVSDAKGRFVFDDLSFNDNTKFLIQARTAKGKKDVDIELDGDMPAPFITSTNPPDIIGDNSVVLSAYSQSARQFYDEQQKYGINKHALILKEVVVNEKKKEVIAHSENLNGSGNADQVITAKDLDALACGTFIECLRSLLTNITYRDGFFYVNRLKGMRMGQGERASDPLPDPMRIVIDGMPLNNEATILNIISPDDVEGVEVLSDMHNAAIYGHQGYSGLIVVTTKRARPMKNYYRDAPGVIVYTARGFYKAREFYSPQYDNSSTNKSITDLRSTIFWKPDIITDKNGKTTFSYFNADDKGTYRVVIEGIDTDGNLGRQVFRYKVE